MNTYHFANKKKGGNEVIEKLPGPIGAPANEAESTINTNDEETMVCSHTALRLFLVLSPT